MIVNILDVLMNCGSSFEDNFTIEVIEELLKDAIKVSQECINHVVSSLHIFEDYLVVKQFKNHELASNIFLYQ